MKTNKTLIISLIAAVCALFIFSCDIPLALGSRLDIEGPLVEITAPQPRTAVQLQFDLEGYVSDESPIKELLVKTSINNEEYPKQWRYTRNSGWEVSENDGMSWQVFSGAVWDGSEKRANWMIPLDMGIDGNEPVDGEYLFTVQAWDAGGFTDDNSYKTRVLIIDKNPPKVSVSNPYLYNRFAVYDPASESFNDSELQFLHAIGDDSGERKDPAMIGKFITQDFQLQWQIDDSHDVWSIDLRLYTPDVEIDGEPGTSLPDNYIYSYHQNTPPGPDNPPDPLLAINPNGNLTVPALDGPSGTYDGGHLKTPITGKTTIRVVAVCFDSAGNPNQEKTLGFFVYWPLADYPWIVFSDGMKEPGYFTGLLESNGAHYNYDLETLLKEETFMIYPGRTVRAMAFHAHGLTKVEYSLYAFNEKTGETSSLPMDDYNNIVDENPQRPNGSYSTSYPWEFTPPPRTGYYVVKAKSFSAHKESEVFEALFRVQDISFPNFPIEPSPTATEPLFKFIGRPEKAGASDDVPDNFIRISGIVSDATEIVSLTMVWINPESRNYAAMSQLQYFRDSSYAGWTEAKDYLQDNESRLEYPVSGSYPGQRYPYDSGYSNRLWKLKVEYAGVDIETGRRLYTYSLPVDLDDLNVGTGTYTVTIPDPNNPGGTITVTRPQQPLSSQVFLLRAENPDGKCTIITYAPQGDTLAPTIKINEVRVSKTDNPEDDVICIPGEYQQVPKFEAGDTITVNGIWTEDSTGYLDVADYLNDNMAFSINGFSIINTVDASGIKVTKTPLTGNAISGTFTIVAEVNAGSSQLTASSMKDTLVVNASIRDIGGNPSEAGASWLIENDNLRFLRISSLDEDTAYRVGETIEIFLEFNKPVTLKNPLSNPVLTLNTTGSPAGRAYYRTNPPQNNENTRHFFTYTVEAGQNTPTGVNLNVDGLSIDGGTTALTADSTAWEEPNYPFTWVYTGMQGSEELRITRTSAHDGSEKLSGTDFYARALPVNPDTTNITDPNGPNYNADYPFTLIGGKRITVDNTAPAITGFSASPQGWHTTGADIYITATFSEMVRITGVPYLILSTNGAGNPDNGTGQTSSTPSDIRVNNNQITFRYTVKAGDTTGTNALRVTGFGGTILDIPGTPMAANAISDMSAADRTLTGVYLDTAVPATPGVAVFSGTSPGGTPITGNPATLYYDDAYIQITGATGAQNLGRIEYTLNGGQNWSSSTSTPVYVKLENKGSYIIQARQIDQAGNPSTLSGTTTFTWDPGPLITRISSTSPNGTYTHLANSTNGRLINVTVTFRKPLTFSTGTPTITHNASNNANVTTTNPGSATNSLSFTYQVENGHATPTTGVTQVLDVTNISGFTDVRDAQNVNVSSFLNGILPAAAEAKLAGNKQIKVQTGDLNNPIPTFIADNQGGTGYNDETSANYHGIRSDDGSYWTTLQIVFNNDISKGSGNITIEQIAGSGNTAYRLPAVLTETQYNRFRNIADFDTYYTKGTNGYIYDTVTPANSRSDTSAKYVLKYQYNPIRGASGAFTGDTLVPTAFSDAFRTEERITINVNSQAVTIVNNNTLRVRLTGSSAPQVPGATYQISYPAGLVRDILGNSSAARTNTQVTLGGVARPFIRIKKDQDTITRNGTVSNTTPRFTAAQPTNAYVRMDSRTPGSIIEYGSKEITYTAAGINWSLANGPNTNNVTVAVDGTTLNPPTSTITPPSNTGNTNPSEITIGNANHGGYKWWVRARARTGAGTTPSPYVYSSTSEEMAFRTAITYRLQGKGGGANVVATPNTIAQQILANGDQIWIRGGDDIGSSSIPGFPFTWEDNWNTLVSNQQRAGIRLMTKVNNTTYTTGGNQNQLNNSQWQLLTWEINATAYVDFILGRDENALENEVWQYGPRGWEAQYGGWNMDKLKYPITPGEHRWMDTGFEVGDKPSMNFMNSLFTRAALTANHPNVNQK